MPDPLVPSPAPAPAPADPAASQYLIQRPQSFSVVGSPVRAEGNRLGSRDEAAAWERGGWVGGVVHKVSRSFYGNDPGFDPYQGLDGFEQYMPELLDDTSQAERDDHLHYLQQLEDDQRAASNGTYGWSEAIVFGLGDPVNLVPIPVVKGIGWVKGAFAAGASNMALTAGTEYVRHQVNPTASFEESYNNVLLSGLIGTGIGAAAGGLAHVPGFAGSLLRRYDIGLGWVDEDMAPVNLNDFDTDMQFEWQRSPQHPMGHPQAGTRPVFSINDEPFGFHMEEVDNVNYGWHNQQHRWVDARELGADTPGIVDPAVVAQLPPTPRPKTRKVWSGDDYKLGKEWVAGNWRQRLERYLEPGSLPIDELIPQPKNYMLYRRMEFLWEQRLPQNPGESVDDWRLRVGKAAMREYKEAKKPKGYAGGVLGAGKLYEFMNFSPGVKAVRKSGGDNVVGDLIYRLIGDNGVQLKSGAPPSIYMKILNDRRFYREVQSAIDAAWYQYKTGQVTNPGTRHMNANWGAQAMRNPLYSKFMTRPGTMDFDTFNAMVGEAVFNPGAFEVNGHPVNAHAREAAKVMTKTFQKMAAEAVDSGTFATQRSLERDIKRWDRQVVIMKDAVNRWLWGQTGQPTAYEPAVSVMVPEDTFINLRDFNVLENQDEAHGWAAFLWNGRIIQDGNEHADVLANFLRDHPDEADAFRAALEADPEGMTGFVNRQPGYRTFTGATHEEAMNTMFNTLADEAIPVSENLGPENYGYQIRQGTQETPLGQSWVTLDRMMSDRVAQLSPAQDAIYRAKKSALDMAEANHAAAVQALTDFNSHPPSFKDIHGNIEDYFPRNWSQEMAAAKREDLQILLEAAYSIDNPIGAAQRASATIDGIIDGTVQPRGIGTMSNMRARELNIPNSFETTHPVTGRVIKVRDFIDMNALSVFESYTRRLMTNINLTRMFGDPNLHQTKVELRAHLVDKYVQPTMTPKQVAAAMERVEEIEGLVDIALKQVKGTLKTRSPAEMSNQLASILSDTTSMMLLPKVLYNVGTDMAHTMMINGIGKFFKVVFGRLADDLDAGGRENLLGLVNQIDDVHDMAKTIFNARIQAENLGMPETGRWMVTDFIRDRINGFFKLNGLAYATAYFKEIAAICAQHNILRDIAEAAPAIKAGGPVNEALLARLRGYGLNDRMIVLISTMPTETWKGGGNLLMPNITAWSGHEGAQARSAMLNAMTGEVRRAVITPGLTDTSSIFHGVATHRGKVVYENDLMKLPVQLLSFTMASQNKMMASWVQGRDRSPVMGMVMLMGLTFLGSMLRMDSQQWKNKKWDELMIDTAQRSGVGGYWLGDLPQMLDRVSGGQYGYKAMLGREPKKRTQGERIADMAAVFGPAASNYTDMSRVFWDDEMNAEQVAQRARKAMIYPQLIWWDAITRNMASEGAATVKEILK